MQRLYNTEALIVNTGDSEVSMEKLNINQKTIAWLNSANGISNRKIEKLLEYFNVNPKELWDNFESEKHNLSFLKPEIIDYLTKSKNTFEEKLLIRLKNEEANIITVYDNCYPEKLKQISYAPYILYCKGNLREIDGISIAVVGSRKATAYGKWAAEKLTGEISELGVNIISGLAVGIDTIAHKTALKYKTKTVGVIGCGIDKVYPKTNENLYKEIVQSGGAVITEYPFGMQPLPSNFHDRNRIISGLSDGVLVIEAQERSGTLITAGHAADQGREIFAVPGNINSLFSKGTNALIKDGAKITTSVDDIIEEIMELKNFRDMAINNQSTTNYDCLGYDEIKIISCLKSGIKDVNEICEETGIDTSAILSLATLLEIKGFIKQLSGNKFVLS